MGFKRRASRTIPKVKDKPEVKPDRPEGALIDMSRFEPSPFEVNAMQQMDRMNWRRWRGTSGVVWVDQAARVDMQLLERTLYADTRRPMSECDTIAQNIVDEISSDGYWMRPENMKHRSNWKVVKRTRHHTDLRDVEKIQKALKNIYRLPVVRCEEITDHDTDMLHIETTLITGFPCFM